MRRLVRITTYLIISFLMVHSSSSSADDLTVGNAGEARVSDNLAEADATFSEKRRRARQSAFPVVLLVPGIMGSKIIERDSRSVLWGELVRSRPEGPNLSLTRFANVDVEILDKFDARLATVNVYGEGQQNLGDLFPDMPSNLKTFPYDWRQDNRISAERMHEWLCNNRQAIEGRHLVVVAHSMGGLVTKYWMKKHRRTTCPSGGNEPEPTSLRVVFVGVPFYGAPKSIAAFSDGFDLLGTKSATILGKLDRGYLTAFVNEYGYTFRSAYQLLPSYRDACMPAAAKDYIGQHLRPFFKRKLLGGGEKTTDDIFSSDFWKYMKWPKFKDRSFDEKIYYEKELKSYLDDALNFHCELNKFRIPDDIKVDYFYNGSINTPISYINPDMLGMSAESALGDGTVPAAIADGTLEGGTAENKRSVDPAIEHMEMLSARELWAYILDIYRDAENLANLRAIESDEDRAKLIQAYQKARVLPGYPLGGIQQVDAISLYDEIAGTVLKEAAANPNAILNLAQTEIDPSVRTSIYSYLMRQDSDNPFVPIFAAKDLAHQQFQNRMWFNAIGTTEMLIGSQNWETKILPQRPKLAEKIINIEGWAKIELGDYQKATDVLKIGVDLGSKNAVKGLAEINTRMKNEGLF